MIKLIIAGGREFADYELLKKEVTEFIATFSTQSIRILSGKAKGADTLGEKFAREYGYEIDSFPAFWNQYGASAGPRRNKKMAEAATHCIIFDMGGPGSKSMAEEAKKQNLYLKVIKCQK